MTKKGAGETGEENDRIDPVVPDDEFWKAKKLDLPGSTRLIRLLASRLVTAVRETDQEQRDAIAGAGADKVAVWAASLMDEHTLAELLGLATGRTIGEIEERFDFGRAISCMAEFLRLNNVRPLLGEATVLAGAGGQRPTRKTREAKTKK